LRKRRGGTRLSSKHRSDQSLTLTSRRPLGHAELNENERMTVTLSPRSWAVVFSPRRKFRTPRTPLDTVDSLDRNKFAASGLGSSASLGASGRFTPRPGRKVCENCGEEAASARLHALRNTSRVDDESNDYHISLCDKCIRKEDRGELKSQLRTARHNTKVQNQSDKRVRKVEKIKRKMKTFWKDIVGLFSASEEAEEALEDLNELDKNLSASFQSWIMKHSMRKSANESGDEGSNLSFRNNAPAGADEGAQARSWRHWAFITSKRSAGANGGERAAKNDDDDGDNSGRKKAKKKRKKLTRTPSSSNSDSDSLSFFSNVGACFGYQSNRTSPAADDS